MGIVWLIGEISNFSAPVSGHWYLTLKDSRAQVKCAMFKGNNRRVSFKPQNGKQVLVKARLSLYEPRGDYQLIIESMQPEGDGRLQQEFEALKMKLAGEGLFSQAAKLPLPPHPKTIGVITSKTGAALHDILQVLKRRDPSLHVIIYPTQVQGEAAAFSIAQAIGRANARNECDILIVGRGGGSLEDLWCFNHEVVARTIFSSKIPIISAVGHEVDVTISDFVADVRAPTPSAAAELVSQDHSHKLVEIQHKRRALTQAISQSLQHAQQQLTLKLHQLERQHPKHRLNTQSQQLDELTTRIQWLMQAKLKQDHHHVSQLEQKLMHQSPQHLIREQAHRRNQLEQRLIQGIKDKLAQDKHQLALLVETLDAVSPLATLKRGYSFNYTQKGQVLTHASQVESGQTIMTELIDGQLESKVVKVHLKEAHK
ncbi:MAG: exodeoxyribonuclease VII large subunit [Vibrio sp.]